MNVNFMGQAWTIKEFLPDMIKNDHGHIVRFQIWKEGKLSWIRWAYR